MVRYTGAIYSVLLEMDGDVDAHAVALSGGSVEAVTFWGVTLGHGLLEARGRNDVRAHKFFESYERVVRSLEALRIRRDGLVIGGGVRSKSTGLVTEFKAYQHKNQAAVRLLISARPAVAKRRRAVLLGQKACKPMTHAHGARPGQDRQEHCPGS